MSHPKMQVVPGRWEDHLDALPKGSDFLGIVTTRQGRTGVLVKLWISGRYAMYTREGGRILDGRDVSAAMGTNGRPKLSEDSAAHSIRLTGSDAMIAERIGKGNLSEGVRLALRAAALLPEFQFVLAGGELGAGKGDPVT